MKTKKLHILMGLIMLFMLVTHPMDAEETLAGSVIKLCQNYDANKLENDINLVCFVTWKSIWDAYVISAHMDEGSRAATLVNCAKRVHKGVSNGDISTIFWREVNLDDDYKSLRTAAMVFYAYYAQKCTRQEKTFLATRGRTI